MPKQHQTLVLIDKLYLQLRQKTSSVQHANNVPSEKDGEPSDADNRSDLFSLVDESHVSTLFSITRHCPKKSIETKNFTLILDTKFTHSKYDVAYRVYYNEEYFADLYVAERFRNNTKQEHPLISLQLLNKSLYMTNYPYIIQDLFYREFDCTLNNVTVIEVAIDSSFNPFERLTSYLQMYRLICTCKTKNKAMIRICEGFYTIEEFIKAYLDPKRDMNKQTIYFGDDAIKQLKFYCKTNEIFHSGKTYISNLYNAHGFDGNRDVYRSELTMHRNSFMAHCTKPYRDESNTDVAIFDLYNLTNQAFLLQMFKHNIKRLLGFRETKYSRTNENKSIDFFDYVTIDTANVHLPIKKQISNGNTTVNPLNAPKKVVRGLHEKFLITKNVNVKQLYKTLIESTINGSEELKQWYQTEIYNKENNIIYTPPKTNNSLFGN